MGKNLPAGTPVRMTAVLPEQLSRAVATPNEASRLLSVMPAVVEFGPVKKMGLDRGLMTGATLSTTVTVAVQELDKPRSSVTISVTLWGPRLSGPAGLKENERVSPASSSE